jgi:hypothetical protein
MTETIHTTNLNPTIPSARAEIAMPPSLRGLVENAINGLVLLLDEIDSDPDLEDNQDAEPSLGWSVDGRPGDMSSEDRELDPAETEPSLGWTAGINQASRNWLGGIDDREQEHDGREPSLGAPESRNGGDQTYWGRSGLDDREDDGDDREPEDGI